MVGRISTIPSSTDERRDYQGTKQSSEVSQKRGFTSSTRVIGCTDSKYDTFNNM